MAGLIAVFGHTVGAGLKDATDCLTGIIGSCSTNGVVGGLAGWSSGMGDSQRALKPLLGIR